MWVLTLEGDMVNLERCTTIDINCYDRYSDSEPIVEVVAYDGYQNNVLCTLESADEDDGRMVISRIFRAMMNGVKGIDMCDLLGVGRGELYEIYELLRKTLAERECESCGGPAQHVDPDGSTFCRECVPS